PFTSTDSPSSSPPCTPETRSADPGSAGPTATNSAGDDQQFGLNAAMVPVLARVGACQESCGNEADVETPLGAGAVCCSRMVLDVLDHKYACGPERVGTCCSSGCAADCAGRGDCGGAPLRNE